MAFVNRKDELKVLDELLDEPGAQLVLVYGRRRVGKTTLLTHWARRTGLPGFYWVGKRDPRELLMADLASAIYGWETGSDRAITFRPEDWGQVFQMLAQAIGGRRAIVILDELPRALQRDRSLGTHIQAAWDHPALADDALLAAFGEQLDDATSAPAIPTWEQIAAVIDPHIEQVTLGDATPEDACQAMQDEASSIGTGL